METGRHREPDPESAAPRPPEIRLPALAREVAFDRITTLAARVLGTPIAIVAIDDPDRVWFPSHYGMGLEQLEQQVGPLASAVYNGEAWMVNGARVDARALTTSAAAAKHGFGFFAGVPLTTHDGYQLGTLCVLDTEPRPVSESDIITLIDLAEMALSELELRLAGLRRAQY
jgi:GAF domain-containing protein